MVRWQVDCPRTYGLGTRVGRQKETDAEKMSHEYIFTNN